MDKLEFRIVKASDSNERWLSLCDEGFDCDVSEIYINGKEITDILKENEKSFEDAVKPGDYGHKRQRNYRYS